MTTINRRKAERVPVGFPVELITAMGFVEAWVRDLSRSGLRFRVKARQMGFGPTADLAAVADNVGQVLTQPFTLNLHYRRLGPLLQKPVRLTRIGLPTDSPDAIELCCEFMEPLGLEESVILEIALPPVEEGAESWCPEDLVPANCEGSVNFYPGEADEVTPVVPDTLEPVAPPIRPRPEEPKHKYRAFVAGTNLQSPPAIFCHTDLVTVVGIRVRLPIQAGQDQRDLPPPGPGRAAQSFVARYGQEVDLRLIEGDTDVWSGRTRVSGVELPPEQPDEMLVTLAFLSRLRPSEMRQLKLHLTAA